MITVTNSSNYGERFLYWKHISVLYTPRPTKIPVKFFDICYVNSEVL